MVIQEVPRDTQHPSVAFGELMASRLCERGFAP